MPTPSEGYSAGVEYALLAIWFAGSLGLAWFVPHRFYVYFASVALIAPAIAYRMAGFGPLEMGGVVHALCAGLYPLIPHFLVQRFRARRLAKLS